MAVRRRLLVFLLVVMVTWRPALQSDFGLTVDSSGGVSLGQEHLDLSDEYDFSLLLSAMAELCDYYNTCNASRHVPDHVQELLGCCVPCDCSEDCHAVGNCCGDNEPIDEALEGFVYVSEPLLTESCEITSSTDEAINTHRHMLVNQCAPDYVGQAATHCTATRSLDNPPEFVLPVFSNTHNISYANVYCAMCNYEDDGDVLDPWSATVECETHAEVTQLRRRAYDGQPLQDGCKFDARPPVFTKPCYKLPEPIDCSGAKFENLCSSDTERYAIYRAMEARICDGACNIALSGDAICSDRRSSRIHSTRVDIVGLGIGPFAEEQGNRTTHEGGQNGCSEDEVRSLDGKRCLHVTCSPSQIDVDGTNGEQRCIDVVGPIKGVCLDYRFVVDTPALLYEHLSTFVVKDITLPSSVIAQKTQSRFIAMSNDTVTYELRVVGEFLYNYVKIPDLYKQLLYDLEHKLGIHPINATLKQTDVSLKSQGRDENGYLAYTDATESDCDKAIALHAIQFCKMVVFSENDYRIEGNVLVLRDGGEFQSHEYFFKESRDGNMHVHVCLESYLSSDAYGNVTVNSGSDVMSVDVIRLQSLICITLAYLFL